MKIHFHCQKGTAIESFSRPTMRLDQVHSTDPNPESSSNINGSSSSSSLLYALVEDSLVPSSVTEPAVDGRVLPADTGERGREDGDKKLTRKDGGSKYNWCGNPGTAEIRNNGKISIIGLCLIQTPSVCSFINIAQPAHVYILTDFILAGHMYVL